MRTLTAETDFIRLKKFLLKSLTGLTKLTKGFPRPDESVFSVELKVHGVFRGNGRGRYFLYIL